MLPSLMALAATATHLLALRGGASPPSTAATTDAGADDDVEPINFAGALEAARARMASGGSQSSALAAAGHVLSGQLNPPMPTSLPDASLREGWLVQADARLLQHEAVTAPGWELTPEHRRLALRAPLPAWAAEVATRLEPLFDGAAPGACDLFACEPGQRVEGLRLDGACVVVLGGRGSLVAEAVAGDEQRCALAPRSLLQLGPDAKGAHGLEATERLLALVWRA